MILRLPNNPLDELTFLQCLAPILLPGTQLAAGSPSGTGIERIYIQSIYQLTLGAFPALSVYGGGEQTQRTALRSASGERTIVIEYLDRWDAQTLPIETIRTNIRAELDRIIANIQEFLTAHEGFTINGVTYPVTLLTYSIEEYNKQPLDKYDLGMTLGAAQLLPKFAILPYSI